MNEIEKMYKNAGVYDFRYDCDVSFTDGQFGRITNCSKGEVKDYCTDKKYFKSAKVINYKRLYSPFTAEKQINLIIFLANREIRISPTYISSGYYLNNLHKIKSSRNISTFENSLAQHINAIWQDLTEEEKQQVKGILE